MRLREATDEDAAAIAALRLATSRQLTAKYGQGTWSFAAESEWSVLADLATSHVFVARYHQLIAATLRLTIVPPWLGNIDFFTPVPFPLYLTTMAVAPRLQRRGVGRACIEEAKRIAMEMSADAIRLDAYDAEAGAAEFYHKCGFTEVRRAPYNGTPLVYFEYQLHAASRAQAPTAVGCETGNGTA